MPTREPSAALPSGVTIRWIDLDVDDPTRSSLESLLDADERARAARLVVPGAGRRWRVARGSLRRLLAAELGRAPETLRFRDGEHGKPSLVDAPELGFNLSHSRDVAVLAISRPGGPVEVGVDVERVDPTRSIERIASRFFTATEAAWLGARREGDRDDAFHRLWTCKEAVVKARGVRLPPSLARFAVRPDAPPGARLVSDDPSWLAYRVVELEAPPGFRAALAWR